MELPNKKEMEEGLKEIIIGMSKGFDKEDKENPIFEHMLKYKEYIKDPDDFNTMVLSSIRRVIQTWVKGYFKETNYLASQIYLNYGFFENNVSMLCRNMYGGGCCVDRGRFLVKSSIDWKETGKLPKFNWKQKYTYHYPPTGTPKQWMDLVEGLSDLLHGNYERYLLALQELTKSHEEYVKKNKKSEVTSN